MKCNVLKGSLTMLSMLVALAAESSVAPADASIARGARRAATAPMAHLRPMRARAWRVGSGPPRRRRAWKFEAY